MFKQLERLPKPWGMVVASAVYWAPLLIVYLWSQHQ